MGNNSNNKLDLNAFKLAVEDAYDHIIITDPNSKILYANRAVERTTGYSKEEIIGNTPALWGGQMSDEFYQKFWKRIKEEKKSFVGELVNRRKDGHLYDAEAHVIPALDDDGNVQYFIGVERDITEKKETEKTRDEFMAIVSHQLKTPLTSIKWLIENLVEESYGDISKEQKEVLKEIYKSSKNMMTLVTDLLNISRIEAGRFVADLKPVQLETLIEEQIEEVSPLLNAKKGNLIFDHPDASLPKVSLDETLYRQVIHNLLTNAIKYSTSKNCTVKISLREQDNEFLLLSVQDNGIGIPKEAQDRIFQRYYRASNAMKQTKGGTGLGLYIIKKIVTDMTGGNIWFESDQGKGTTFFITIPKSGMKNQKDQKTQE